CNLCVIRLFGFPRYTCLVVRPQLLSLEQLQTLTSSFLEETALCKSIRFKARGSVTELQNPKRKLMDAQPLTTPRGAFSRWQFCSSSALLSSRAISTSSMVTFPLEPRPHLPTPTME